MADEIKLRQYLLGADPFVVIQITGGQLDAEGEVDSVKLDIAFGGGLDQESMFELLAQIVHERVGEEETAEVRRAFAEEAAEAIEMNVRNPEHDKQDRGGFLGFAPAMAYVAGHDKAAAIVRALATYAPAATDERDEALREQLREDAEVLADEMAEDDISAAATEAKPASPSVWIAARRKDIDYHVLVDDVLRTRCGRITSVGGVILSKELAVERYSARPCPRCAAATGEAVTSDGR